MTHVIFSPRAVSWSHGTGVQLRYFMELFPGKCVAFNYAFVEKGIEDPAISLESLLNRYWPFKMRGRRFISRCNRFIPLRLWSDDELTDRGAALLRSKLPPERKDNFTVVVVHDERSAKRFNSINQHAQIPYALILYDWMHVLGGCREAFPNLTKCLKGADQIYAISPALQRLANQLVGPSNGCAVDRIGFYRPRPDPQPVRCNTLERPGELKIFILADAKEGPFRELVQVLQQLIGDYQSRATSVHFVGNAKQLVDLPECQSSNRLRFHFHGVVSAYDRDRIASGCDVAFLAGPASDPNVCPLAKYSLPSKLGDFAAVGLPVIARVAYGSAAHEAIREEMSEFVIPVLNRDELSEIIDRVLAGNASLEKMRQAAFLYANAQVLLPEAMQSLPLFSLHQ